MMRHAPFCFRYTARMLFRLRNNVAVLFHTILCCTVALTAFSCATPPPKPLPDTSALSPSSKIAVLQDAVEAQPENAEAHYELGNALFDLGRINEARMAYAEAVRLNPEHSGALCNLGLCQRYLGDISGAIESYEQALAIDPDDLTTLRNMTIALQADGNIEAAIPYHMRITELSPNDVQAYSDLGKALLATGRYVGAAEAYERVLQLDPGYAGDYYNLGLCYFYLEDWEQTLTAWLTALAHNPDHPSVHKGLTVVYWRRGEYDKAWEHVVECQRLGVVLAPEFIENLQRDSGRVGPSSPN